MKDTKKFLLKKAEESTIWLLEQRISRQNKLLMNLKSQGEKSSRTWKNICYKRNIYRKVLLDKLKKWEKGELPESELNPNYGDYLLQRKHEEQREGSVLEEEKSK